MPSFIDGWASNEFAGMVMYAPTAAGIPTDAQAQLVLEYTVSGASGSSTLAIAAGDQSKGTGRWAGILLHDDGTYGVYMVSSVAGGVCTVWPKLRATVTGATLRNMGGSVNGQHYTEPGYRALARKIYSATIRDAYRNRWAAQWRSGAGVKEDWARVGGLGAGQYSISIRNNFVNAGSQDGAFWGRARILLRCSPTDPVTGKGVSRTFVLGGASGHMELYATANISSNGQFRAHRVLIVQDGATTLHDVTYDPATSGLNRIVVPFVAASSITVTVTNSGQDGSNTLAGPVIDCVTFWVPDRVLPDWTARVIDKNAKTVVMGDSWTSFYSGVLGSEVQSLMAADGGGGEVISVGVGGTTAEQGLASFDSAVVPHAPSQVLINYFTNDHNQYGDAGYDRWRIAMYRLGIRCQEIGARPIFVMPLPTSSLTQAIGHGIWSDNFGQGLMVGA